MTYNTQQGIFKLKFFLSNLQIDIRLTVSNTFELFGKWHSFLLHQAPNEKSILEAVLTRLILWRQLHRCTVGRLQLLIVPSIGKVC